MGVLHIHQVLCVVFLVCLSAESECDKDNVTNMSEFTLQIFYALGSNAWMKEAGGNISTLTMI